MFIQNVMVYKNLRPFAILYNLTFLLCSQNMPGEENNITQENQMIINDFCIATH